MTLLQPPTRRRAPARPGAFWERLAEHGDRTAVLAEGQEVGYAELAARVGDLADRLGRTRRLVMVTGANTLDSLVGYLACLAGGHPVLLAPGGNPDAVEALGAAYDPDVVLDGGGLHERRPRTRHALHPDLALLLTTSGTTGSPKLVRLSHDNLASNAAAIADYLRIRPDDVAPTTLPMHYCYGLSVVNSHLAAGATLLLTERSVVDPCFWDDARRHGVTSLAGVPYTFDLLDRTGFADLDLPTLRYLTQAGGRLAPERVRAYAALGRRRGFDLVVMYGQTEATARMAYLPPDLAEAAPGAIGRAIPGGSLRLEPLPEAPLERRAGSGEPEVGELVYEGPNVMLGYATTPADLARGREVHALRTGDVARRRADGLFEVVGRRSRVAKVFGLRVDLDQVERVYAGAGHLAHCVDGGDRLVVAVDVSARPADPERLLALARDRFGLPPHAVEVLALDEVPRLPSGKPDHRAIAGLAAAARDGSGGPGGAPLPGAGQAARAGAATTEQVRAALARVLGREVADTDTFVSLGGDSLSYVEASLRLEEVLGRLPAGWHTTPVGDLAAAGRRVPAGGPAADPGEPGPPGGRPAPRRTRTLETNVLLRAAAIVAVVGTHANLFTLVGGAHLLLGVAGFNFGRFQVGTAPRAERVRRIAVGTARVAVPSVLWLLLVAVLTRDLGWRNVLLVNGFLGPRDWAEPEWWYWFVEALVWTLVGLAVLLAVPAVDRLERARPFWFPFGLALAGLLTRYDVLTVLPGDEIHRASVVFWLFALGWATVKATQRWQRALVSLVVLAAVPGFFSDPAREAVVAGGMLLLVWLPAVRVPDPVARLCGVLASASLYVYLAHWQVYPHLEDRFPLAATVLALAAGVVLWQVVGKVTPYVERALRAAAGARQGEGHDRLRG